MFGLINEGEAQNLRTALESFYRTTLDYTAFCESSHHPDRWQIIVSEALKVVARKGGCRVLEFGAGRSGFGRYFRSPEVTYVAQDITPANVEHLKQWADEVQVGDIASVEGRFDVIFSTFVFEHVTRPERILEKCWDLLLPGGVLLLFCPRYDMPFYLPPSLDHVGPIRKPFLATYVLLRRGWTWLCGRPAFLLVGDPSLLHRPWSRDRDAVHLASTVDLAAWSRSRGTLQHYPLNSTGLKDWVVKNLLQISVSIRKPSS